MALDLPPLDTLRHILDRLKANDISWFKEQFSQGKFAWLKDRLPGGEYEEIESKVQAGDLGALRGALGKIDLPGMDLFKGLGGAAAGAVGAVGAGAAGAVGAAGAGAAAMAGKGMSGIKGATTVLPGDGEKKGKAWLWAVPIVAGIALLAILLPRCGGSSDPVVEDDVVDTSVVADETVPAESTPVETTPAETTPAETTPAETTPAETVAAAAPASGDILAVAEGAGSFKTLAAAVGAAGLTETLQGAGPFTVFAPTDDAFAKLPAGAAEALLKPENKEALTKVLTYHVLPGKVLAADVAAGKFKTVEGSEFEVTIDGDKVKVNDANVTATDVEASNGVIHVIDTVLIPPSVDVAALLAGSAPSTEPPTTEPAAAAPAAPENLTVYFGNASSRIDAAAKAKIDGAIEQLKALPAGTKVIIVGHASPTGNPERNKALSIERANNVKDMLAAGLPDNNVTFTVEARGDSQPDVDEAKSRKVTIEIQP